MTEKYEELPEPIWKKLIDLQSRDRMTIYSDEIDSLNEFLIPNISGKVLYDVGAFRGIWSIVAWMSGAKEVHLFEPNKVELDRGIKNMKELGAKFFTCPKIIWDEKTKVTYGGWNAGTDGDRNVEAIALDSYGGAPDFIKIDTEGAEVRVLNGAKEMIERYHPMLMIEDHVINLGTEADILSRFPNYKLGAPIKDLSNHRHIFLIPAQ